MVYYSNADVFLAIAEESYAAMRSEAQRRRRPKADGSGYIISLDVTRTSFKNACVTVAFAAMHFEAITYLAALNRFGHDRARKIDYMPYEERLEALGITEAKLLTQAKDFRLARKELVHEKAIELGQLIETPPRFAQDLAEQSMVFLAAVRGQLIAL